MWFNNALVFQCEFETPTDMPALLAAESLKPCPPHARFIYGWLPVIGDEFVHEVADSMLICMGKEERLLPRGVINKLLQERVINWEATNGRSMKRAEKAQLGEELEFELLPKAFCLQKRLHALFDIKNKRLLINTASTTQATQLTAMLRKTIPSISIEPMAYDEQLANQFSDWIINPATLPESLQLGSDCLLVATDDDKKRFNCKGYELPSEEIISLLTQGLKPAEISIVWNERIQLTLTNDLILKRIKCQSYLVDEFNEAKNLDDEFQQQDAELTLMAGEFRSLVDDLLACANKNDHQNSAAVHTSTQATTMHASATIK